MEGQRGFPYHGFSFSDSERYEFLGSLGKGGYGSVYKIANKSGRVYACKVFDPDIMKDPRQYRQFLRETHIGINISHEHLVSFHKNVLILGQTPETQGLKFPCIVMDFVDGLGLWTFKRLFEHHYQKPFPRDFAVLLMSKTCLGLEHLHGLSIRHGDIKPANILISRTGYPKVTDYGIATSLDENTTQEQLSGTLRYLAPEQIVRAKTGDVAVDLRADVYSLGVVALELTVGLPFPLHGQPGRVIDFIVRQNRELRDYVAASDLPHQLKFVISSCLHQDVGKRPQSIGELQDALLQALYGSHRGVTLEDVGDCIGAVSPKPNEESP